MLNKTFGMMMTVIAASAQVVSSAALAQVRGNPGRPGNPNGPGQPPRGWERPPHDSPVRPTPGYRPYTPYRPPVINVPGGGPVGTYPWYSGYRGGPRVRYDWSIYGDRYYRRTNPYWYVAVRTNYGFDPSVVYLGSVDPDYASSPEYAQTKSVYDLEYGVQRVFFTVEGGNVEIDYVAIEFADGSEPQYVDFREIYSNSRTFYPGESYTIDLNGFTRTIRSITVAASHDQFNYDAEIDFWADRRR